MYTCRSRSFRASGARKRSAAQLQRVDESPRTFAADAPPIHRYADPKTGLKDGAIFGFGSGTNPNCLLLIELRAADREPPQWQFGFVGMSAESLRAKFEGHEVWYFPPAARIGGLDTWIWFFEAKGMEDDS